MDDKLESKNDSRTGLSLASISFYQSFPNTVCMLSYVISSFVITG